MLSYLVMISLTKYSLLIGEGRNYMFLKNLINSGPMDSLPSVMLPLTQLLMLLVTVLKKSMVMMLNLIIPLRMEEL